MIEIKNESQIQLMAEGGQILGQILKQLIKMARAGVSTRDLDQEAEDLIGKALGRPSFKMVPNYKFATCLCVNEVVVHGLPSIYILKEGDILGIDVGIFYKGFHLDAARSLVVGNSLKFKEKEEFLKTGEKAMIEAIQVARVRNRVGDISKVIQQIVEAAGYSVVRELTGHGIGRTLHEEPPVPCFLEGEITKTPLLKAGMTLAIEVIYNQGGSGVVFDQDGWTVRTKDDKLSGLFEDTVAITNRGPIVLTKE